MHTGFLFIGASRIRYCSWGTGNKVLLCFHGYGESAESFTILEESLAPDFTVFAIDLPFHGGTDWKEGLYFDPETLVELVTKMVADHNGPAGGWHLLGYSMGGRVALDLLGKIPEKIEKLVLLAPDGLKVNGWYWLATQSRPGNWLFRKTMQYPGWFFFILRLADKLKFVNQSVYKFTIRYIGQRQVREELYQRWTTMRDFRPDIPSLRALIREKNIPVRLMYGRYDRIILWERGQKFIEGIEPFCELVILDCGHQLLERKNKDALVSLLKE
ncbi:alpha/beta fold hydrolase [Flavitalea flava]